tara:strand:+ start:49346 stop:50011 length:666 start_codon:yes stop_codon:yes gene_type:complete
MKLVKKNLIAGSLAIFVATGCSSIKSENPLTGEKEISDTATWTAIGATSGAALGGLGGGFGAIVGGAIGAAGGAYYGYSLEDTRAELEEEFVNMGISVNDDNGYINISLNNNLLFGKSDFELTEESLKVLDSLVNTVGKMEQEYYVRVVGHTDTTGTFKHNVSLSETRAKTVAMYLYEKGLTAKSIDYTGMADRKPLFENNSEENMAKNRRVEISIIPVLK